jgi:L-ascorbate metabolism protein UlaG (beta-lactamase superfamily)
MQLTWMGHSCIRIEQDGFVTVIDPGVYPRRTWRPVRTRC